MAKKVDDQTITKTSNFYFGVGRRKEATARVRLYPAAKEIKAGEQVVEKGQIFINNLPAEKYFPGEIAKAALTEPYRTTNTANKFKTTVIVSGSGKSGQLGAVVLGIARALVLFDSEKRPTLRKKGLLTRDPRARERKKPGLMGARKRKSSPKR